MRLIFLAAGVDPDQSLTQFEMSVFSPRTLGRIDDYTILISQYCVQDSMLCLRSFSRWRTLGTHN